MIKVVSDFGEFVIDEGKFISGNDSLKKLYDIAMIIPLQPHEGPVDYAIASRMMKNYKWEVLEEVLPETNGDIAY
jgi:hypothetical protein